MSLTWISSNDIVNYKYKTSRIEVLLYSSASCQICQAKLVPIFHELSLWPASQWKAMGLKSSGNTTIRMSALDTSNCTRPNLPEVKNVLTVPFVQMWAPAKYNYDPLSFDASFDNKTQQAIKQMLVNWIVKHVNEIR